MQGIICPLLSQLTLDHGEQGGVHEAAVEALVEGLQRQSQEQRLLLYKGYQSINGGSRIICLSMNLLVFLGLDSFIPHLRWETVQHKVGDFSLPSLSWIGIDILPHK